MIPSLFIFLALSSITWAQWDNLPPARLTVAQASPAVSSQAVINQPNAPERADSAVPPKPPPVPKPKPSSPPSEKRKLDPLLDPQRPKDCQLVLETEQAIACGKINVTLPAGTYKQVKIVEDPHERRVDPWGHLEPQNHGLGYVRYLSDVPIKVDGAQRDGGIDVPVLQSDNLPIRIWYRKMKEPDDLTKAFSFILPPVALFAGAGAWTSGNLLFPDAPPAFDEYRDYFVKPPKPPLKSNLTPQPSHVRPLGTLTTPGASNIRSK